MKQSVDFGHDDHEGDEERPPTAWSGERQRPRLDVHRSDRCHGAEVDLAVGRDRDGRPALTASVDAFVVGISGSTTTYDFEAFVTASTKNDCKNGGWQNARRSRGKRDDLESFAARLGVPPPFFRPEDRAPALRPG